MGNKKSLTKVAFLFGLVAATVVSWGQTTTGATGSAPAGRGRGRGGNSSGTLPADAPARDEFWGTWATSDPKIVGTRVALNLTSRRLMSGNLGVVYLETCAGYGSLRFAQAMGDKALADKLVARYAVITTPEGRGHIAPADHVDRSVFGIVPLEIYKYNKDKTYLDIGKNSADLQWGKPPEGVTLNAVEKAAVEAGLTYQTRYWVDDMFMITSLQVQAFRVTGDKMYLDRAAKEMVSYLDKLQKPNGLFYHADDTPFFWGRGNGWYAAGMAELLTDLPADHKDRARIMEGYKKMMAALLTHQSADGMWRQLIDKPESWAESSCTGMFTFGMAIGVKKGWLEDPAYKAATKKAWTTLCTYLDENANIREVCQGTNTAAAEIGMDPQTQLDYYLKRQRIVGDLHGQAGLVWASYAMMIK